MNSWIILLLLLGLGRGGNSCNDEPPCGYEPIMPLRRPGENTCGRDRGSDCDGNRDRGRDCDMDREPCPCGQNNDSHFEPRFDARPFNNNNDCGCDGN